MTSINPAALLAAQVYGGASAHARDGTTQRPAKPAETPRFEIEDKITLRNAPAPKSDAPKPQAPAETHSEGAGRRESVHGEKTAFKRPGTLVDIRA